MCNHELNDDLLYASKTDECLHVLITLWFPCYSLLFSQVSASTIDVLGFSYSASHSLQLLSKIPVLPILVQSHDSVNTASGSSADSFTKATLFDWISSQVFSHGNMSYVYGTVCFKQCLKYWNCISFFFYLPTFIITPLYFYQFRVYSNLEYCMKTLEQNSS